VTSARSLKGLNAPLILTVAALALAAVAARSQDASPKEKGPAVGRSIPAFKARDQFGREQTLSTLAGPKGLLLLFVRSADW
jgi:hypothetical protein